MENQKHYFIPAILYV